MEKIKEIFGSLPDHEKTLFVMEGLTCYIPPKVVDDILSFIVKNSGKGSAVIFDYFPESLVNGTCALEVKNFLSTCAYVSYYK